MNFSGGQPNVLTNGNKRRTAAKAETKGSARAYRRACDSQPIGRLGSAVWCPARPRCAPATQFQQYSAQRPFRLNHPAEAASGQTEAVAARSKPLWSVPRWCDGKRTVRRGKLEGIGGRLSQAQLTQCAPLFSLYARPDPLHLNR